MAFRSAQDAKLYAGQLALAAYSRQVAATSATAFADITTLADRAKVVIPATDEASVSFGGPLDVDATANGQYAVLSAMKTITTAIPVSYMPLGTSDRHAWLMEVWQGSFDVSGGHDGSVDWAMTGQHTGRIDYAGVVLSDNATVTTDTNGTSIDGTAGTTNGGVAHLHVTAYSTLTSDAIIIQQSTTGAWAGEQTTLATFTTVTGLTSQRLAVTGTVSRYLRVVDDVTGAGSITRFVAFSRR